MEGLSPEQQALKGKITTSAIVWGAVAGIGVALLALWLLGSAGELARWLVTIILGPAAGYFTYRWRYSTGVAKAVCKKCGTAFGIREVSRLEQLLSSEQRKKVEQVKPATKIDAAVNRTVIWIEEKYEVTAVDECFKCHDRTERKWTVTREKDRAEVTA
ncbi:MAG: hypothetical protein ACYC0C_01390 [Devosia sp.]